MLLSWRDNTSYCLSSQDEEPGSEMSHTKKHNCWPTGPLFPNFKMGRMRKKGVRGWERETQTNNLSYSKISGSKKQVSMKFT